MEYLIDTNIALWSLAAPARLSTDARRLLEEAEHTILFSSISVVEFKLKCERLFAEYDNLAAEFPRQLSALGFTATAFAATDAVGLGAVRPNRDPFDRMLCSQAMARSLTLITADRELLRYAPVKTLW